MTILEAYSCTISKQSTYSRDIKSCLSTAKWHLARITKISISKKDFSITTSIFRFTLKLHIVHCVGVLPTFHIKWKLIDIKWTPDNLAIILEHHPKVQETAFHIYINIWIIENQQKTCINKIKIFIIKNNIKKISVIYQQKINYSQSLKQLRSCAWEAIAQRRKRKLKN